MYRHILFLPHLMWCAHYFASQRERGVPDPVKLIRRISAMEVAIRGLQSHCAEIAERRTKIAPAVIEAQQENALLVLEVSESFPEILAGLEPASGNAAADEDYDSDSRDNLPQSEWSLLVQKLDEQAKFFVPASDDIAA